MKKFILFIAIITCISLQSNGQFTKANLQAMGLTCAICSNAVNQSLQKLPFVQSVKTDLEKTAFNVYFKPDSEVNIDAIKEAVEAAGFTVGNLKLTGNFYNLPIKNDEHFKIGNDQFHFLNSRDQVINGEITFTILDKSFVSGKTFKTVKSYSKKACVETGKASICCEGIAEASRIYHVTI